MVMLFDSVISWLTPMIYYYNADKEYVFEQRTAPN